MIDIPEGKSTPRILLNHDGTELSIEGQSFPENAGTFYQPLFEKIKDIINEGQRDLLLNIRLIYINTSSTKTFFLLFDMLDEAFSAGKKVEIRWFYNKDNELGKELGEDLLEDLSLPYSLIEE